MKTYLKRQESYSEKAHRKSFSFLTQTLAIIAVGSSLFAGSASAAEKGKFDPAWDKIDSKVTKIAEYESGLLYKQNAIHIVVMNSTDYEMGRQYGHLLKEQINWHFHELKNDFMVRPAGNNPVDRPAPLLNHDELTPVIFLTAHDEPEVREQALGTRCFGYLRKSEPADVLLSAIRKAAAAKRHGPDPADAADSTLNRFLE